MTEQQIKAITKWVIDNSNRPLSKQDKEIIKQASIKTLNNPKLIIKEKNDEVKEAFNSWLKNIRISMHLCKYRQVINEIESNKYSFKSIPEEHLKYQVIEIDAIFKLLRKKIIQL